MKKIGQVFLIGAGPGDPELITLKALKILRQAEVILYDALINSDLLNECFSQCEKVFVGKRSGCHILPQTEINQLLLQYAKQGKIVARLKGGDPFLFGRGGEEVAFLHQHKIKVTVIPGLSSAIAVPTVAGISLTHRDFGSDVVIVSGHKKAGAEDLKNLPWEAYVKITTIVFLMGVKNLAKIVKNLLDFGKSKTTPVTIIQNGTLPNQKIVKGTLSTIVVFARKNKLKSPAVIVVGLKK